MNIDFGFITCAKYKNLTTDDELLFTALKNKGYKCKPLVWNDSSVNWQSAKILLLRSAWDYHLQRKAFLKWIDLPNAIYPEQGDSLVNADPVEIDLAKKIIKGVSPQPLYARVDLLRDHNNKPCLVELELIDPKLFFKLSPSAIEKCADSLIKKLDKGSRIARYMVLLMMMLFTSLNPVNAFSFWHKNEHKVKGIMRLPSLAPCDLKLPTASADAVALADQLNLTPLLHRLENLRQRAQTFVNKREPLELREQINDVKQEILEIIEQTRLEIEFTHAELAIDVALQSELLRAYTEARDKLVNTVNAWSFRTNGALWAIAEGLDIPTYSRPRYSVSSGTVGILAGLVPSVFSLIAIRESKGRDYEGKTRPNMLSKIFGYPTTPQIDYPDSIVNYLNSAPAHNRLGKSRLNYIIDRWAADEHIHTFTDRNSKKQLDLLTGLVENHLTIDLVGDRLTMLQQLSALIQQMNRPLLEIMMVVRGTKRFQ